MQIKDVKGGKRRRGEVIEYSPEEKALLAIKDAVSKAAKEDIVQWTENDDIEVTSFTHTPRPNKLGGKYDNRTYVARGKAKIRCMNVAKDRLKPKCDATFVIEFEDTLDGWGMPDLKVLSFDLKM